MTNIIPRKHELKELRKSIEPRFLSLEKSKKFKRYSCFENKIDKNK